MNTPINAPYVTEKTMLLAGRGYYTFVVDVKMRKPAIKGMISDMYKVHVLEVKTIKIPGKTRRMGKKMITTTSQPWKKTLVRLASGEKINAFEIPVEPEKQEVTKK